MTATAVLLAALAAVLMPHVHVTEGFAAACEKPALTPQFLTPQQCDAIVRAAEVAGLRRSTVQGDEVSESRTSSTVFLTRTHPAAKAVFDKVEKLIAIPQAYFEDMQIVRYDEGQQYKEHFDSSNSTKDPFVRTDTVLCYLNDDFEGGGTHFPKVNTVVTPQTGLAVWWKNVDAQDEPLPCSLHAGLPVHSGVKYACNIWVRRTPWQP